jgi:hypothetical protein
MARPKGSGCVDLGKHGRLPVPPRATDAVIREELFTSTRSHVSSSIRHRPSERQVARATSRAHSCTGIFAAVPQSRTRSNHSPHTRLPPPPPPSLQLHLTQNRPDRRTLALLEPLPGFPMVHCQSKRISRNTLASRKRNPAGKRRAVGVVVRRATQHAGSRGRPACGDMDLDRAA